MIEENPIANRAEKWQNNGMMKKGVEIGYINAKQVYNGMIGVYVMI